MPDIRKCPACGQVHDITERCSGDGRLFRLIDDVALDALPDAEWTIENMSQRGTLEIIAGPSGAGKTTFAATRGCHQATGQPFLNFGILRAGPVIYAALEGIGAFKKKIHTWKQAHGFNLQERIGVHTINEPVNLLRADAALGLVIASESIGGAMEIYIDTVARATSGNEDNDDLSLVVAYADHVRRETGARVTLIHHFGKDKARGSRGGSALPAAADTVLTLESLKGHHVLKCDKQRDGAPFDPVFLRLVPTDSTALFERCEGQAAPLFISTARLQEQIGEHVRVHPGLTGSAIAKAIGRKKVDVLTALLAMRKAGTLDYRNEGKAMLWEPST